MGAAEQAEGEEEEWLCYRAESFTASPLSADSALFAARGPAAWQPARPGWI